MSRRPRFTAPPGVIQAEICADSGTRPSQFCVGRTRVEIFAQNAPPPGADRPGGHARAFDWSLVAGIRFPVPWLLAGGLTPENVAQALAATGAPGVDVSSGVESSPGVKDPAKVLAFVAAARESLPPPGCGRTRETSGDARP